MRGNCGVNDIVAATVEASFIAACDVEADAATCGADIDWELVVFKTRPFTAPLEGVECGEKLQPPWRACQRQGRLQTQAYIRPARGTETVHRIWRRPVSELEQEKEPQQQHLL